jgi:hypothetical protein
MLLYNVVRVTIWATGILVFGYILLISQGCGSQTDKQYNCIVEGDQCELVDGDEQPVVVGPPGERGDVGPVGERGESGSVGESGVDGVDGESCTVTPAINGALIECSDSTVLVLNGTDGERGEKGDQGDSGQNAPPTAYTVTEVIDPCGNHPTRIDEVLLKLANGSIIASFSDNVSGLNTRFAIIEAGTYGTTDGTGCIFRVNNAGVVTW